MLFAPEFLCLENMIREVFNRAKVSAGPIAAAVQLDLTDEQVTPNFFSRAEISVSLPDGPVRITWAAVATLWAASQAAVRLGRRMLEAKKAGQSRIEIEPGSAEDIGMLFMDLSQNFMRLNGPAESNGAVRWHDLPKPDPSPDLDSDDARANFWFQNTLEWIIRHELAHVVLLHGQRDQEDGGKKRAIYETEADSQATDWLRGELSADPVRELGTKPEQRELELEARATMVGFGLVWVAMLEASVGATSGGHPPIAERLLKCLGQMGLREDSFALEVTSDLLKVWMDPQGTWQAYETPLDAFQDAAAKLQEYMDQFPRR